MEQKLKATLLGIPLYVWIAQLLYVALSLGLLAVLVMSLGQGSVSAAGTRLFIILYILVMLVADIAWRIVIKKGHFIWVGIIVIAAFVLNIMIAQAFTLQSAHSSFNNYYKFRGCAELVSKSATSGTCRLPSGDTIKIVEYKGKWYLSGDLPGGWF